MKKITISLLALVALSACSPGASEIEYAKKVVSEELFDPSSAEFSDVAYMDGAVCGWVNGRNRMGGYVGSTKFLVKDGYRIFSQDTAWEEAFRACSLGNRETNARFWRDENRELQGFKDRMGIQ